MRVLIAGAGSVGRSIARELLGHGHAVTLVDHEPAAMRVSSVAQAEWLLADACSPSALEEAGAPDCDVVVAATGDDKANLVVSLLAKSEFAVPRVVARINNPKNEWLFDESWGVDVPVSTPRIMTALVEEAVSVGDLVGIFRFHRSGASIQQLTLPDGAAAVGRRAGSVDLGPHTVLAALIRDGEPLAPEADTVFEGGDELLFVVSAQGEADLSEAHQTLVGGPPAAAAPAPR